MTGLGAVGSVGWTRCGCDVVQTCRGLYTVPMRVLPPRSSVRVVAQVDKSGQGRAKKTTSNAVDANAASLNSAANDVEGRVSSGDVLRLRRRRCLESRPSSFLCRGVHWNTLKCTYQH